MDPRRPLTFFGTVRLLLSFARKRAAGRVARQRELMRRKKAVAAGKAVSADTPEAGRNPIGVLGSILGAAVAIGLHLVCAHLIATSAQKAEIAEVERDGKIALPRQELNAIIYKVQHPADDEWTLNGPENSAADHLQQRDGGARKDQLNRVKQELATRGAEGFVLFDPAAAHAGGQWRPIAMGTLGLGLFLWLLVLTCQGEGLEMDVQRRRHPLWEWLLSHPIRPAAMILAEAFAPLVSNPFYYTAPMFWIGLLSHFHPLGFAVPVGLVLGAAVACAASLLNKTIEASALLRLGVRNRGALLGLMSWFGFAGVMLPFFLLNSAGLQLRLLRFVEPLLTLLPPLPGRLTLGLGQDGSRHAALALGAGLLLAGGMAVLALGVAIFATAKGLVAGDSQIATVQTKGFSEGFFGRRDPVFRKELLWFSRDKGAVIQAVLIPLTVGAMQAFNLQGIARDAIHHWPAFCGLAIICATYFLLVLGPRSLTSEGAALWISLTWPRGLEDLLRAKARLWQMLANAIFAALMIVAVWLFPAEAWKIALVSVGWVLFCRSMAMRAVTMVTATSESGEAKAPSMATRYVALLGVFMFSGGVMSQNWHVAIIGVIFCQLFAAASWQNLRARLPYLYDSWSEKLPPAPTLLHAMIGVGILVEVVGVVSSIALGIGGPGALAITRTVAYGLAGLVLWLVMRGFLAGRGVKNWEIWRWATPGVRPDLPPQRAAKNRAALALGIALGAGLGLGALGYVFALHQIPDFAAQLEAQRQMASAVSKYAALVLAVGFAPLAEEYLFRGLLYRALDREWGGWRAMAGSAAYFAIYHPPLSWLPVFALGLVNAWLFRRTRWLWPCVVTHMIYNAIVVGLQ
jgi:membrane protease YdiL (CAAX protease family)